MNFFNRGISGKLFQILVVLLMAYLCHAEETTEQDTTPKPQLNISWAMPESPFFIALNGKENDLVMNVQNVGEMDIKIFGISAHFVDVNKPDRFIQNMSYSKYELLLPTQQNSSILYKFLPNLPPAEFGLVVYLDVVNKDNQAFRVTAVQGKLTINDPEIDWFDPQSLFIYLVVTSMIIGVLYAFRETFFSPKKRGKKVVSKPAPLPHKKSGVENVDEDWLPKEHLQQYQKTSKPRRRRG